MRLPVLLPRHRKRLKQLVTMNGITEDEQRELYDIVLNVPINANPFSYSTEGLDEQRLKLKRLLHKYEVRGATYVY